MKKLKYFVVWLAAVLTIAFGVKSCLLREMFPFKPEEHEKLRKAAYNDNKSLVKLKNRRLFALDTYLNNKGKGYTQFLYADLCGILIFRQDCKPPEKLEQYCSLQDVFHKSFSGVTRGFENTNSFSFLFRTNPDSTSGGPPFLKHDGKLVGTYTIGDSVIIYNFVCTSIGLSFEDKSDNEVALTTTTDGMHPSFTSRVSNMAVALVKRSNAVYYVLIYPNAGRTLIEPNIYKEVFGWVPNG